MKRGKLISLRVSDEEFAELQKIALEGGRSVSDIARIKLFAPLRSADQLSKDIERRLNEIDQKHQVVMLMFRNLLRANPQDDQAGMSAPPTLPS